MLKRHWKWFVAVPVALVVLIFGGTLVYIHFIAPDPAPKLTFSSADPAFFGVASETLPHLAASAAGDSRLRPGLYCISATNCVSAPYC